MLVSGGRPRTQSPTSGRPGALDPVHLPENSETFPFPLQSPSPRPAHFSRRAKPGTASAQTPPLGGLLSSPRGPAQLPSHPTRHLASPGPLLLRIIHFCFRHSRRPETQLQRPDSAWSQSTARPAVKVAGVHNQTQEARVSQQPWKPVSSEHLPMNLLVPTSEFCPCSSCSLECASFSSLPLGSNSSGLLHII